MKKEKATGWRIPIIFCLVIGAMALMGKMLIPKAADPLDNLAPGLKILAQKTGIDRDSPENAPWDERIMNVATAFAPQDMKDEKLSPLALEALKADNLAMACASAAQIGGQQTRREVLIQIAENALPACDNLVWGVFAARRLENDLAQDLVRRLNAAWEACHK